MYLINKDETEHTGQVTYKSNEIYCIRLNAMLPFEVDPWTLIYFIYTQHGGMQNAKKFLEGVLSTLLLCKRAFKIKIYLK